MPNPDKKRISANNPFTDTPHKGVSREYSQRIAKSMNKIIKSIKITLQNLLHADMM